jgi:hypothetical protein
VTRLLSSAMLIVMTAAALPAIAQDKEACVASSESAQKLRTQKKLRAARKELVSCAQEICPAVVKKDCVTWLKEVDDSLPTVIVAARDGSGNDLTDVRVTVDGELLAERIEGSALAVDPGAHTFKFESAGTTVESKVLIRETEKNRVITVTIGEKPKPIDKPIEAPPPAKTPDAPPSRGIPTGAYVFGAVAAASFVGFAYFGLSGRADRDSLKETCAPYCNKDDEKPARTKLMLADVSLAVGIVSLGIATVMVLTAPSEPKKTGMRIDAVPVAGGAVGVLGGSF